MDTNASPLQTCSSEGVAQIALARPEVLNAMNLELARALADELTHLALDPGARAIVITGTGGAFSAGGDLQWIRDCPRGPSAAVHELAGELHRSILEIRRMPKAVIAAINGPAAGAGFSLALACDFRVIDEGAKLQLAYTSRGLSIDGGGSFSLPRLVGMARALELAGFDEPLTAERAQAWGIATRVAPAGTALHQAVEMAGELAARSTNAFGEAKLLLNEALDTPLEVQLERERAALERSIAHTDGREGLAAFLEKRPPTFSS